MLVGSGEGRCNYLYTQAAKVMIFISLFLYFKCSLSCIQGDKMNLPSLTVLKELIIPSGSKPPLIKESLGCP